VAEWSSSADGLAQGPGKLAPVSVLSDRDVLRIAELSRLALSVEERSRLGRELAAILTYVEQIGTIDTAGIEPTSHVQLDRPTLRADELRPSLSRESALRNAPDAARAAGLFRVPKVIG
jgi:aspartyl-tRNA(Asn)/glutamyl-tRNA(Gln) amidotransferase subunit C